MMALSVSNHTWVKLGCNWFVVMVRLKLKKTPQRNQLNLRQSDRKKEIKTEDVQETYSGLQETYIYFINLFLPNMHPIHLFYLNLATRHSLFVWLLFTQECKRAQAQKSYSLFGIILFSVLYLNLVACAQDLHKSHWYSHLKKTFKKMRPAVV